MKQNRSIAVVAAATILFGIVSKWLVGLPYMVWGHFDVSFILSFILWTLYSASLYLAGQMNDRKDCFCAIFFGMITAAAKAGLDAAVLRILGNTDDLVLSSFAMGIGIIVFGCLVTAVLHCMIFKRKFVWKRPLGKYAGILSGTAALYGIAFFYFSGKTFIGSSVYGYQCFGGKREY